jgi:carbon monoxide dehydrogenase subunit G
MASIHKSIRINAPVQKVFDFMGDPMNNVKTMSAMQEVSDIQDLANGGKSFRWKYRMAGMSMDGKSEDVALVPNQYREISSKGGVNSTWKWTFDAEEAGTRLTLDLEYSVPLPLLGKLAEAAILKTNEQEAEAMMEKIKGFSEAA